MALALFLPVAIKTILFAFMMLFKPMVTALVWCPLSGLKGVQPPLHF